MKKTVSLILALVMIAACCIGFTGCQDTNSFSVGICQLMKHDSLDQATQGFKDALTEAMNAAGKDVTFVEQIPGSAELCTSSINVLTAQNVDLIMANATPALLAAANATTTIPVLGTSVTDYADTFGGNIPANVSGTSDAVPFADQAKMMITSLNLVAGDKVGVLFCSGETNSRVQYEAVKALFEAEGIVVCEYTFAEATDLQAVVTGMVNECKAVYIPSDNTVAQNDALVGSICDEYNIPVYTSYGGTICYASLAIDYYELGVETGKMAADILLGNKKVSDIEVAVLTPSVAYNKEKCAALGIEIPEN